MKINLTRLAKSAVRVVKQNPDKALIVASMLAPGIVAKVASKVVPVVVALGKPKR
jgi:hypothetical protein